MIHVERQQAPAVLTRNETRWNQEAIDAVEGALAAGTVPKYEWLSSRYGHRDVRKALLRMFQQKCAYCESRIGHVTWEQVEHYRPKAGFGTNPLGLRRPGYYWLGYSWDNLLLSCPRCNQRPGKANQCPISGTRARTPTDNLQAERPLLIDPTREDPRDYLDYDDGTAQIHARDGSKRGRETIAICQLNRDDLLDRRREHLEDLRMIERLRACIAQDPSAPNRIELEMICDEMTHRLLRPEAEYRGLTLAYFGQ